MPNYRKPDGEEISDGKEYMAAWEAMIQPVADATGLVLYAFDPDFALQTLDGRYSVSLPMWFVKRLNRGLADLPQEETQTITTPLNEWIEEARKTLAHGPEYAMEEIKC